MSDHPLPEADPLESGPALALQPRDAGFQGPRAGRIMLTILGIGVCAAAFVILHDTFFWI